MTTLLAFAVTIGILVVIHEYGHYAVARLCGVKVLRFSVGFGKVIARHQGRGGTEWALSAIPLGGYVKMLDEREGEVAAAELPDAFNRKPVLQRMAIVVAGPLANLILAVLLYWGLFVYGVTVLRPVVSAPAPGTPAAVAGLANGDTVTAVNGVAVEDWQGLHWQLLKQGLRAGAVDLETRSPDGHLAFRHLDLAGIDLADAEGDPLGRIGLARYLPEFAARIGDTLPDSPAARAGLQAGDTVLAIDDTPVAAWEEMVAIVRASPERPLRFRVERDGRPLELTVTPAAAQDRTERIGRIGATPHLDEAELARLRAEVRFGPVEAMQRALYRTWDLSAFSLEMLGRLVIGQASLKNLSGPVTIADYAGKSAEAGLAAFIGFLALISVSLAVLNLLPIPLLDGGHLLYYSAEFLTGRPLPDSVQAAGQKIGAALLAALMMFALFNDLQRLFAG
ncbi:MAG: RIP metalloprotease RseP [Gallionellaceae bacterium]|nr:RIP metalloprotease RseP [Gallionellaceae bacterium]